MRTRISELKSSIGVTLRIGLPIAAVLACALIGLSFIKELTRPLAYIEEKLIDYRMVGSWDRTPSEHPSIAIVTISEDDLAEYENWIPTPRDFLARVLTAIDEMAPRAIGLDYLFTVSAESWLRKFEVPGSEKSRTFDGPIRAQLSTGKVVLIGWLASNEKGEVSCSSP